MIWIAIALASVILDQLTKYYFSVILPKPGYYITVIENFFEFERVENPAAGFGILADSRWVFMTFSAVAIVAIIVFFIWKKPKSKLLTVALSLILGGGIGNMIDRFGFGVTGEQTVFDFVGLNFFGYEFPRFNIADACISIGAVLLAIFVIFFEGRTEKKSVEKDDTESK